MNNFRLSLAATLLGSMLIGCERDQQPPPAPADSGKSAQQAPPPQEKSKAPTADATAEALFEAYRRQVSEQKWDQADATLRKLEGMKGAVSQPLKDEIENSRAGFDAARQMNAEPGSAGRQ